MQTPSFARLSTYGAQEFIINNFKIYNSKLNNHG